MSLQLYDANFNHHVDILRPFALCFLIIRNAIGVYNTNDATPTKYPNPCANNVVIDDSGIISPVSTTAPAIIIISAGLVVVADNVVVVVVNAAVCRCLCCFSRDVRKARLVVVVEEVKDLLT